MPEPAAAKFRITDTGELLTLLRPLPAEPPTVRTELDLRGPHLRVVDNDFGITDIIQLGLIAGMRSQLGVAT